MRPSRECRAPRATSAQRGRCPPLARSDPWYGRHIPQPARHRCAVDSAAQFDHEAQSDTGVQPVTGRDTTRSTPYSTSEWRMSGARHECHDVERRSERRKRQRLLEISEEPNGIDGYLSGYPVRIGEQVIEYPTVSVALTFISTTTRANYR